MLTKIEVPSRPAVSEAMNNLISLLTVKEAAKRIGYMDISDIKRHAWFEGFDWKGLVEKTMPAPYVPDPKSLI